MPTAIKTPQWGPAVPTTIITKGPQAQAVADFLEPELTRGFLLPNEVQEQLPSRRKSRPKKGQHNTAKDIFAIPELLQRILGFLPSNDLLASTRVSRYWHSACQQSPTLRKRLTHGPRRHYSDRALSVWTFDKVQHNIPVIQGKPAGFFYLRLPTLAWRLEHLPMFTVQLKGKVLQCRFLWHADLDKPKDMSHEAVVVFRHTLKVVAGMYLSDPALPCAIECLGGAKREVVVKPCDIGELMRLATLLNARDPAEWVEDDRACLWKG